MRQFIYAFAIALALLMGVVKPALADEAFPMLVYEPYDIVPQSELIPLGAPEDNGGTVLQGDITLKGRFDFLGDGMAAGIFQATTRRGARVRVVMPFSEHATVIIGRVTLTDEFGNRHTYNPGDSYFIRQGSVILWEQSCPLLQKSFFNYTMP